MFATVDAREVRVLALAPLGERELGVPRFLRDEADRAATLPTEARMRALARALAPHPERAGAPLRIEIWETRFAASPEEGLARRPERLRALVVDPEGARPAGGGAIGVGRR